MSTMDIRLNPDLDAEVFAEAYTAKMRGQIPNILPKDVALNLHDVLINDVPWQLTYFDGQRDQYIAIEELQTKSPQERMAFGQRLMQIAKEGFGYSYNTFKFHEEFGEGNHPDHPLRAFDAFLSSPPMINFIRTLIGDPEVTHAGAHATWFGPGHFLNLHTDQIPGIDRRAAFVFNFTKSWMPDWGGELKFYSKGAKSVEEAYLPSFNMLNVFTVPKPHAVGFVSPFAGAPRLAITGWFYAGEERR